MFSTAQSMKLVAIALAITGTFANAVYILKVRFPFLSTRLLQGVQFQTSLSDSATRRVNYNK